MGAVAGAGAAVGPGRRDQPGQQHLERGPKSEQEQHLQPFGLDPPWLAGSVSRKHRGNRSDRGGPGRAGGLGRAGGRAAPAGRAAPGDGLRRRDGAHGVAADSAASGEAGRAPVLAHRPGPEVLDVIPADVHGIGRPAGAQRQQAEIVGVLVPGGGDLDAARFLPAQRREDELTLGIGVGGQPEPTVLEAHRVQVRAAGHPRLEGGEDPPPRVINRAAHGDAHQASGRWAPAWAVRVVTTRLQQAVS